MARTKKRYYPTVDDVKEMFQEYFRANGLKAIGYALDKLGYENSFGGLKKLLDDEGNMKFGFDCGWVNLYAKRPEQAREWRLDGGLNITEYVWDVAHCCLNVQSVTIKRALTEKAIFDLGVEDLYGIAERLD